MRRKSIIERMDELRQFCWQVLHSPEGMYIDGKFTVLEYARAVRVSTSYANRLLKKAAALGVIEIEYIDGHNGVDKIVVDPQTVDQPQFPF